MIAGWPGAIASTLVHAWLTLALLWRRRPGTRGRRIALLAAGMVCVAATLIGLGSYWTRT